MLEGTSTIWNGLGYYELMVERVDGGRSAFSTELQNDPSDPSTRHFLNIGYCRRFISAGVVWLQPLDVIEATGQRIPTGTAVPLSECKLYMTCDPSLGESASGDPSALQILARSPDLRMFSLESDVKLRKPDRIISDMVVWAQKYPGIAKIGVESVAFQLMVKAGLEKVFKDKGIKIPILALKGAGMSLTGKSQSKEARIDSLQPDIENSWLLIGEGQRTLENQLYGYPMIAQDDALDALEMARTMARLDKLSLVSVVMKGDTFTYGDSDKSHADLLSDAAGADDPWYPRMVR
jgi:predicted phage terminase large subunit-like protein